MKKSKIILALVLAIVFIILCVNVPTFSWFSRPHNQSGEQMVLSSDNHYKAYNGESVTISTMSSTTGRTGSYTTSVEDSEGLSGSGITTHNRKYFCTTISNTATGAVEQNVSLYANTLSIPTGASGGANGTLALGVNGPTRSYRDYSSLSTQTSLSTRDAMRIYFQKPKNTPPSGWTGTEFYICWNEDTNTGIESLNALGSNGTYYKMTYCGEKDNYYNYYADIPKTATHAFFACENWAEGKQQSDLTADNWKKRTQTLWNLGGDGQSQLQSKVYQLTSTVTNGNTQVHTPPYSVTGACINNYYNTIFVTTGSNFDATLSNTTNIPLRIGYTANYIGSLEYYSSDDSVFKIYNDSSNGHTKGVIYPQGAGEAKLYTKAVGSSYSDSQQVETTVKVTAANDYVFNDVPIVRNLKIPAGESVDVYWYVINNSETEALRYTIDSLYIGM